jgi:hypothetical protein
MTKYIKKTTNLNFEFIERINDDNSVSFIPLDPANSDYQAYLEHEAAAK